MPTSIDQENNLTIKLLSYDRPTGLTERFSFLEMTTLQATTLLSKDKKVISCKIVAYDDDNKYLDEIITKDFKTMGDFNDFFKKNPDIYIHDCEIELADEIKFSSHDDGEVSIQFQIEKSNQVIIESIFEKNQLDKRLIDKLKSSPGHYIAIDKQSNITGSFINFDDYLKNGRKAAKL